jgi:glycosyltransferase involved in cell wall biosynthesis
VDSAPAAKRVALLLPSLKFGGAERVALNLAYALQDAGVGVEFLLMSHEGEFLEEALRSFKVVDLGCNRTWKLPLRLLSYLRKSRTEALISSFWKLNLCACVAKVLYPGFRLLLWEHSMVSKSKNSPTALYGPSASFAYRFADRVVCVSHGVRRDIAAITIGLERKLVVIFNPIRPPTAAVQEMGLLAEQNRIVWVGRMIPAKNPGLLLEAFALLAQDTNASLVYVGEGPERFPLEVRARELGLSDRVTFTGFQADPYQSIVTSRLLVLSSDHEGFGNVLVEALYCGLRVVSTDCGGGVREILQNRYGTIVPLGDAMAMAAAISSETSMRIDGHSQRAGAQRFLPEAAARQFMEMMQ